MMNFKCNWNILEAIYKQATYPVVLVLKQTLCSNLVGNTSKSSLICLENKGFLLVAMVPWRTFNIHENFPFHKMFFIVEKRFIRFLKYYLTT